MIVLARVLPLAVRCEVAGQGSSATARPATPPTNRKARVMSEETYPWPLDPSVLTPEVRLSLRQIALAAIRETSEVVRTIETPVGLDVISLGDYGKANRVAFDSLRIPYELVTPAEFSRRRDGLAPMEVPA